MSDLTNTQVPNLVLFKNQYKELVQKTVLIRKEINHSQSKMAEWIGVERRRYIKFESCDKYDFELLLLVCDKLSIEVKLIYDVQ